MKKCKTCKYWDTKNNTVKYNGGHCQNEKITEDYYMEYKSDMMIYPYLEGGVFWTGPKFGCVHHENISCKMHNKH